MIGTLGIAALVKRVGAFLSGIPVTIWLALALVAALGFSRWQVHELRHDKALLVQWQADVITAATAAFGTQGRDGRVKPFRPPDVVPAITAAATSLRDLRGALQRQSAAVAAVQADGSARRATSKQAAKEYDRTKKPKAPVAPPKSPGTDVSEAWELARAEWAKH